LWVIIKESSKRGTLTEEGERRRDYTKLKMQNVLYPIGKKFTPIKKKSKT